MQRNRMLALGLAGSLLSAVSTETLASTITLLHVQNATGTVNASFSPIPSVPSSQAAVTFTFVSTASPPTLPPFSYTLPADGHYVITATGRGSLGSLSTGSATITRELFRGFLDFPTGIAAPLSFGFNGELSPAVINLLAFLGLPGVPAAASGTIDIANYSVSGSSINLTVSGTVSASTLGPLLVTYGGGRDVPFTIEELKIEATLIPEPAALALLGLGLVGLATVRRREAVA